MTLGTGYLLPGGDSSADYYDVDGVSKEALDAELGRSAHPCEMNNDAETQLQGRRDRRSSMRRPKPGHYPAGFSPYLMVTKRGFVPLARALIKNDLKGMQEGLQQHFRSTYFEEDFSIYIAEECPRDAAQPAAVQGQWLPAVQDSQEPKLQWANSLQQYVGLAGPEAPHGHKGDPVASLPCIEVNLSRNDKQSSDRAQVCNRSVWALESAAGETASKSRSTLKLSRALGLAPIQKDKKLRCASIMYPSKNFRLTPATGSSSLGNKQLPPLNLPDKLRRCRQVLGLARPTSRKEETHQLRAALAASLSTG